MGGEEKTDSEERARETAYSAKKKSMSFSRKANLVKVLGISLHNGLQVQINLLLRFEAREGKSR